MAIRSFIDRLRRTVRELRAANGANVTVTFALATVPMVGFVGAAVDYSHANSVKAAMQAASDSTALMLSKTAATMTNSELQTKALDYFKALFTRPEATGLTVSAVYNANTGNGAQVVINASSNVKANFMGLVGLSTLKVGVDSQVRWGNTRMRVALALDTTGSMDADGKMDALKVATKSLLTQLQAAASKDGDVYVSIVPFSKDVNVGKGNYQATWIDWDEWEEENGDDVSTTTCTNKKGKKKKCTTSTTWKPDNRNTWNGCVTDRGKENNPHASNYDTNVTPPSVNIKETRFTAEQYGSCSPKVMPLNYDWSGMKNLVDSFYPAGNTNQGIGMAHAWMSLVGGGPYPTPPAEDSNYKYSKIIILMSDGLNTENRWYDDQSQIDARQAMTCANAKAAGIIIYTVHVNTGGDPTSTSLKTCASSADKFTEIKKASQLLTTFNSIGTALSNLRIAQ
jgi:Flp pilus assembly protein TadG